MHRRMVLRKLTVVNFVVAIVGPGFCFWSLFTVQNLCHSSSMKGFYKDLAHIFILGYCVSKNLKTVAI